MTSFPDTLVEIEGDNGAIVSLDWLKHRGNGQRRDDGFGRRPRVHPWPKPLAVAQDSVLITCRICLSG